DSPAIVTGVSAFPVTSATAEATFRLPAPASIRPAPGTREFVSCSATFTWAGVSDGRASRSSGAAPDTPAAAMLVPLNSIYDALPRPLVTRSGYVVAR